jgi:hypothetical protein
MFTVAKAYERILRSNPLFVGVFPKGSRMFGYSDTNSSINGRPSDYDISLLYDSRKAGMLGTHVFDVKVDIAYLISRLKLGRRGEKEAVIQAWFNYDIAEVVSLLHEKNFEDAADGLLTLCGMGKGSGIHKARTEVREIMQTYTLEERESCVKEVVQKFRRIFSGYMMPSIVFRSGGMDDAEIQQIIRQKVLLWEVRIRRILDVPTQ